MAGMYARLFGSGRHRGVVGDELPLAGELYSVEHLEQYATLLATKHKIFPGAAVIESLSLQAQVS